MGKTITYYLGKYVVVVYLIGKSTECNVDYKAGK